MHYGYGVLVFYEFLIRAGKITYLIYDGILNSVLEFENF